MEFLAKAQSVYLRTQGNFGPDYIRVVAWQANVTALPYYGITKRGLSAASDVKIVWSDPCNEPEILYMLNEDIHEYIKLCDVKRITRATLEANKPDADKSDTDKPDTDKPDTEKTCADGETDAIQRPDVNLDELVKEL